MKRFSLTLALVLAYGVAAAQTYHNEEYGYSIDRPVGWEMSYERGDDMGRVVFEDPRITVSVGFVIDSRKMSREGS